MMKNLKKLIYQYNFLKLELDDIKEEHSSLSAEFELLFSDIIPPQEIDEEALVKEAKEKDTNVSKKKPAISESTKKVYKDVAKKLHPDAGGADDSFKELNERYKKNDLLGVVSLAVENNIDFEISDEDESTIKESISKIEDRISHYKTTLAYVWKHGNTLQRRSVIQTLSNHFGRDINMDELNDEIKKLL